MYCMIIHDSHSQSSAVTMIYLTSSQKPFPQRIYHNSTHPACPPPQEQKKSPTKKSFTPHYQSHATHTQTIPISISINNQPHQENSPQHNQKNHLQNQTKKMPSQNPLAPYITPPPSATATHRSHTLTLLTSLLSSPSTWLTHKLIAQHLLPTATTNTNPPTLVLISLTQDRSFHVDALRKLVLTPSSSSLLYYTILMKGETGIGNTTKNS